MEFCHLSKDIFALNRSRIPCHQKRVHAMAGNTSTGVSTTPSSCFHLLDPIFDKVSERFLMNLVTAIINIIASPFAVISNVLITVAIFNNARLRTPSNILICCLALSDILVGLAVQPGYITYRLMENQHRSAPCFVRLIYANAFYICCGVSFMTLTAVSYERFVAVRLLARYNNLFSSKRVLKYVVIIWVLNILLTTLQWVGVTRISKAVHLMVWLFCLLVSGKTHVGIVWVLRRHRLQMQPQQTINENIRKQREARISRSVLLIVGVYFLLNTPVLLAKIYHQILQQDIKTYNHFSWTETLAFLNSCTNPMICFWKNRQVRQGVLTMLKTICCYN